MAEHPNGPPPSEPAPSERGTVEKRLQAQFPALGQLRDSLRGSKIPFVQQTMATDCGAASLAMTLGFLGRHISLDEVRRCMAIGRDGVTARAILDAGVIFGLRGRGVKVDFDDVEFLPEGSILHWSFSHFVVFEKLVQNGIWIVDPAFGRRLVLFDEARKEMTGVALLFEKTEAFEVAGPDKNPLVRHAKMVFAGTQDWGRIAVVSIFLELVSLVLPLINGRLIDRVVPRNDTHLLFVLLIGLSLTVVFFFAASLTRSQLLVQLRTRFDARMTFGFLEHMLRLPYGFFERRQVADLQMRVGSVAVIREVLTGAVLSGCIDGVLVISHLLLLTLLSPKLMAISLLIVTLQAAVYLVSSKKLYDLAGTGVAKQAEAANALNELLSGMESLKASGTEHRASQQWAAKYVEVMNTDMRQGGVATWSDAVLGTFNIVGPLILLIGGVFEVMHRNMTLGTMLSATALAVGFMHPMMELIGTLQKLQMTRVHINRIDDVLDTPPEQETENLRIAPRLTGAIELDRVSFKYGPRLPLAVKAVSLKIRPGECIAIVGRSGSGKTTLGRLLLGLYPPNEGTIRFDGIGLDQLDLRSVRRQLGVVVQRPHIFGTTIRANIALGDSELPLTRVISAAKRACIAEDIEQMPMQYDTPVVAGGSSLSGGQRQRIALARALVGDPVVVLLDEATSALDAITESAVQEQLERLECTRISIAHRLSTVVNADRILVMDNGSLVEQGTHDELIALGNVYSELVEAQLAKPRPLSIVAAPASYSDAGPSERTEVLPPSRMFSDVVHVNMPKAIEDDEDDETMVAAAGAPVRRPEVTKIDWVAQNQMRKK